MAKDRKLPHITLSSREVLEAVAIRFGKKLDKENEAQRAQKKNYALNLGRTLFREQLDFINDPNKRKAAICSRRSGKSYAAGRYLIQEALNDKGTLCVYIARTREAAKRILWTELKQVNQQYRLGIRFNNADLICTFPNGSQILFTGANDASDVDKLRGAAFSLVVMDEAAFFNIDIKELVNEVLTPALLDKDGSLVLISTPNSACTGFFYEITEKKKYNFSVHSWTVKNNPYMQHAVRAINDDIARGILNPTDPSYRREYLGVWARDDQDMVYRYSAEHNLISNRPEAFDWEYVMGIDLGYHDATAFLIAAYSPSHPHLYLIDEYKQKEMLASEVEEKIHRYMKDYDFTSIVMDTGGGSSRMLFETFKSRSSLPLKPAKKTGDKVGLIKLMNSDIANGTIKVIRGMQLLQEWDKLQYNKAGTAEDRRFDNHLSDAALYAWMESRHYLYEEAEKSPEYGTEDYWTRWENETEERLAAEQETEQFDPDTWGVGYSDSDLWVQ